MKIKEYRTVVFNSTPDNYAKECSGRKRNTVRMLSLKEKKYLHEREVLDMIEIVNSVTKESFTRMLTDVTVFTTIVLGTGYRIYIFSW